MHYKKETLHLEGEKAGEELLLVPDDHDVADDRNHLLDGLLDDDRRNVLASGRDDQLLDATSHLRRQRDSGLLQLTTTRQPFRDQLLGKPVPACQCCDNTRLSF